MNILLFLLMLAGDDVAKVTGPKEIPVDRHEEISRVMISTIAAQRDEQSAEVALAQAKQTLERAQNTYAALIEKLRKEFGAEGCELTMDKKWQNCPAPKPAEADEKEEKIK